MHADPFDASPGQRVPPGALAALAATAMENVHTLRMTTRGVTTDWGIEHPFRIEIAQDTLDAATARQRVLTLVDGQPVHDLVVIGQTAWEWRTGEDDYAARPFVEGLLAGPAPTTVERALDEEMETEVWFLDRARLDLPEGPTDVWLFSVLDARAHDEDHSTSRYTAAYDASHRLRRIVVPPFQSRGESVTDYHAFNEPLDVQEPFGHPVAPDPPVP